MAGKRNPHACDPIMRKGGAHVKSKSGQRHRSKDTLLDEVEAYMEERRGAPCKDRGRPTINIDFTPPAADFVHNSQKKIPRIKSTKVAGLAILMLLGLLAATASSIAAPTIDSQTEASVAPKVMGIEGNLEADDLIRVEVAHLDQWAANNTNNSAKLVPYLNGLAIRGNYPEEIHTSTNHVHFHLRITHENRKMWVDLLGTPDGIRKPVAFSV
ncbi:MAG: hypothetical protein ACREDU_05700, partial [Methylocella sp.]